MIAKQRTTHTLADVFERFVQEEKVVMDSLQVRMSGVADVNVQSAYKKLAEIRSRYLSELELEFGEIKSRAEITRQINDMFL
ncbi:MAG: hypothetical protein L0Y80_01905 [Ignavibacteriae bacterium]|nr:hypothetical protein [Ignavibacteriota bacterium]